MGAFVAISVVVLAQGAYRVAHKIRAAIEGLDIEHSDSPIANRLIVSVGVASATPTVDSNWEELEVVAAENRALGDAKQSGRNKLVAADEVSA